MHFRLRAQPQAFQACAGGDNRDRTDDPLLAKQVLSQLSYTPVVIRFGFLYSVLNEPQKLNNDLNLGPNGFFSRPDLGMLETIIHRFRSP